MCDGGEGRPHGIAVEPTEPVGEHHGVARSLFKGNEGANDEGAGVGFPVGGEVVVGVASWREDRRAVEHAVEVGVFPRVHHPVLVHVFVDGFEHQVRLTTARVIGVVSISVAGGVLKRPVSHVEGHGDPCAKIDEIHRVVGEVMVVTTHPSGELRQIKVLLEGDRDGLVGAPAVEFVEALTLPCLEEGRGHQRGVDAQARGRRGVGEGRHVVGKRDLRQGPVPEIPAHPRSTRRPPHPRCRGSQRVDRSPPLAREGRHQREKHHPSTHDGREDATRSLAARAMKSLRPSRRCLHTQWAQRPAPRCPHSPRPRRNFRRDRPCALPALRGTKRC